ncbi:MAG: hypothetical protein ACFFD4_11760 [Candidatus Odinarchaeota archaeon]
MYMFARKFHLLSVLLLAFLMINTFTAMISFNEETTGDLNPGKLGYLPKNPEPDKTNINLDLYPSGTVFTGGETIYVSGRLDLQGHEQTIGSGPFPLPLYLPCQEIVVQSYNPGTGWVALPGLSGDAKNITTGSDANGNGIDDSDGVANENFDSWTDYRAGNFSVIVVIPDRAAWGDYGLDSGSNEIRAFYAGNTTIPIQDSWNATVETITLSKNAVIEASSFTDDPSVPLPEGNIAQGESTNVTFTTKYQDGDNINETIGLTIDLFYDSDPSPARNWVLTSPAAMNMIFTNSTGTNQTNTNGQLTLKIQTSAIPSTPENDYMLNVTADLEPTFSGFPYFFLADINTSTIFTVENPVNTAELEFYTGDSSDKLNAVRPGTNKSFTLILRAHFDGGNGSTEVLPNIPVSFTLWNETAPDTYVSVNEATTSTIIAHDTQTDVNGYVSFQFNSTYNPSNLFDQKLLLNITADITANPALVDPPNFIVTTEAVYKYNMSISQLWDTATILESVIYPPYIDGDRPLTNGSWALFVFRIEVENGTNPGNFYYPGNVPVNASLDGTYPGIEIHPHPIWAGAESPLGSGFYLTNNTGYVTFNVSSMFPDSYIPQAIKLDVTADFTDPSNLDFRFVRNATHLTGSYSIDPDYSIGYIELVSSNVTSLKIRPGEAINMTFRVYYINQSTLEETPLHYVPVNFTFTKVAGLDYVINNPQIPDRPGYYGYYYTVNGNISVTFTTAYGITAEELTLVGITATADFQNDSSSDFLISGVQKSYYYLMGEENAVGLTWDDYNKTWSEGVASFEIDPQYEYAMVECLNGTIDIRPGDWTLVTFRTRLDNGTVLASVPVNVTLEDSYPGVDITLVNYGNPSPYPNYYLSNASGLITWNISTTYDGSATYPKTLTIYINATANYTSYGETYHSNRWIVGHDSIGSFNLSQKSFDTLRLVGELGHVNVDPNYYIGIITFIGFNATIVQQTEGLAVTFRVIFDPTNQPAIDKGLDNAPIQGVPVQLNTTHLDYWNITYTITEATTNSDGRVTFNLTTTLDTMQNTDIELGVYADFENDSGVTVAGYPEFKPLWLNGTDTGLDGKVNATYSSTNSTSFKVVNQALITAQILATYFPNGTVYRTTAPWKAMRDSVVTVVAGYKEAPPFFTPLEGELLNFYINDTALGIRNIDSYVQGTRTTNSTGHIEVNVTIPTNVMVEDVQIIIDDGDRVPEEFNATINLPIVAELTLTVDALQPQNGKEFLQNGNTVTFSGNVRDELGNLITSPLFTLDAIAELNAALYLRGLYPNGSVIEKVYLSLDASGYFSNIFTIPVNYNYGTIIFQVLVNNTVHFIGNTVLVDGQTARTQKVYQNVFYNNLFIYYPNGSNSGNLTLQNNTIFNITGYDPVTGARKDFSGYYFLFTLIDNWGRSLPSMTLTYYQNGTATPPIITDSLVYGFVNETFSIAPATANTNHTYYFTFQHDSSNSTAFALKKFTLNWVAKDLVAPFITLDNDFSGEFYQKVILFNLTINDTADEYIYSGMNYAAGITVRVNGSVYTNIGYDLWNETVLMYQYALNVDDAGLEGDVHTVNFTVFDLAGNSFTKNITLRIDNYPPIIVDWLANDNSSGFVTGMVTIYVNATDSNIDTGNSTIAVKSLAAASMLYDGEYFYYEVNTTPLAGDLSFTVWIYDLGGRGSSKTVEGAWTIDNDAPVVNVDTASVSSWNTKLVTPNNSVISASLTINDGSGSGFPSTNALGSIGVYLDGVLLQQSAYSLTNPSGDTYLFSWNVASYYSTNLSQSDQHTLHFRVVDKLGNVNISSDKFPLSFKVDIYQPQIAISYSFTYDRVLYRPSSPIIAYGDINSPYTISTTYTHKSTDVIPVDITGDFRGTFFIVINITDNHEAVSSGLVTSSIEISLSSDFGSSRSWNTADFTKTIIGNTHQYTIEISSKYISSVEKYYENFDMVIKASDNSFNPDRESHYEFRCFTPRPAEQVLAVLLLAVVLSLVAFGGGLIGAYVFEKWYYE